MLRKELSWYRGKKVLITGHTGFKGSWLSLMLDMLGAKVYGYSLNPPTEPNLFTEAHIGEVVHTCIGDIRNYDSFLNYLREVEPELVFHLAAQPLVRQSYVNPLDTFATNVMGTADVLDAVRHVPGVRTVIVITTDKCYENKEWIWAYRENEPLGGYDPYSSSKACAELVTTAFRNSFFSNSKHPDDWVGVASARAGNVIGGGDWATDRLIPDFIRAISKGDTLKLRNPQATRPWQHVLEPLTGYLLLGLKLTEMNKNLADAWNFGPLDSDVKDVEWISAALCRLWGDAASYTVEKNEGGQPHEANHLKLDSSKAMYMLGWRPRWNIEQALSAVVDWHKNWLKGADAEHFTRDQIEAYFN